MYMKILGYNVQILHLNYRAVLKFLEVNLAFVGSHIHFWNPLSSLITAMYLVSSLHVVPYSSWASYEPWGWDAK